MIKATAGRKTPDGPRHAVKDPQALAGVVADLIASPVAGFQTVDGIAKRTKINRSTWYRLLGGKHPAIAQRIASHLQRLVRTYLGKAGERRFLDAITYPGAVSVTRAYYRWGTERWTRQRRRPGPTWDVRGGLPILVVGKAAKLHLRERLADELDKAVEAEVPQYGAFVKWMQSRWVDQARLRVAKMRIIEPFLEAYESQLVEMRWGDLPKLERLEYVRAAIKNERWLLERRGAHQERAEAVARQAEP